MSYEQLRRQTSYSPLFSIAVGNENDVEQHQPEDVRVPDHNVTWIGAVADDLDIKP